MKETRVPMRRGKRESTQIEINKKNETSNEKHPIEFHSSKLLELDNLSSVEFCSLLCTPKEMGGAGISDSCIKQLLEDNYGGPLLNFMISHYKANQNVKSLLQDVLLELQLNLFSSKGTLFTSISAWVGELFKTKLYHLWSCEQLALKLVALGLSAEEAIKFVSNDFNGERAKEFFHASQQFGLYEAMRMYSKDVGQLKHCQILLNWISTLSLKIVPVFGEIKMDIESIELKFLKMLNIPNLKVNQKIDTFPFQSFLFDYKISEELVKKIQHVVQAYYICYHDSILETLHIPFICIEGGYGSGKTRMIEELPSIFTRESTYPFNFDVFKITKTIYIDCSREMKSGTGLYSTLCEWIIYSIFSHSDILINNIPTICSEQLLFNLFKIISEKLHFKIDLSIPIPLIIAFDNIQHLTKYDQNNIQYIMTKYITTFEKEHGLLIIPVFTSTPLKTGDSFLPNDLLCSITKLKLTSFTKQETQSIISSQRCKKLKRYEQLWNVIGCVPRHLESAISNINYKQELNQSINHNTIHHIYDYVKSHFLNLYEDEIQDISLICLSGLTLSDKIIDNECEIITKQFGDELFKKVNSLKHSGLIYELNSKYQLPLIVIDRIDKYGMIQSFISKSNNHHEILSELCLKTILYRFMILKESNGFEFGSIFHGAIFSDDLKTRIVNVSNMNSSKSFTFSETTNSLKEINCNESTFYKIKREETVDGMTCLFKIDNIDSVILTLSIPDSCQNDNNSILTRYEIVEYYLKAKKKASILRKNVLILMITNRTISVDTMNMIRDGEFTFTINGKLRKKKCSNLMIIHRDCYKNFFNEFIAQFLL